MIEQLSGSDHHAGQKRVIRFMHGKDTNELRRQRIGYYYLCFLWPPFCSQLTTKIIRFL